MSSKSIPTQSDISSSKMIWANCPQNSSVSDKDTTTTQNDLGTESQQQWYREFNDTKEINEIVDNLQRKWMKWSTHGPWIYLFLVQCSE